MNFSSIHEGGIEEALGRRIPLLGVQEGKRPHSMSHSHAIALPRIKGNWTGRSTFLCTAPGERFHFINLLGEYPESSIKLPSLETSSSIRIKKTLIWSVFSDRSCGNRPENRPPKDPLEDNSRKTRGRLFSSQKISGIALCKSLGRIFDEVPEPRSGGSYPP